MKLIPLILLVLTVACARGVAGQGVAGGAEDAARPQVVAATKDAVTNLLDEVERAPLTRRVSVRDFLQATRSTDEMVKVLQRAQQMGGPRWTDDHTCQIELQISGPVVAQQLKRAAAADRRNSPLSPAELDQAVRNWDERAFTATGTATSRLPAVGRFPPRMTFGGNDAVAAEPREDPWQTAGGGARDQAVAAAAADAAYRVLAKLRPIPLTARSTVGDALAVKEVGEGMRAWLVKQPTARVEVSRDLEATVELAVAPDGTFDAFRDLARKQREVAVPTDDRDWDRVREQFERRMPTPVGRGVAPLGGRNKPAEAPARGEAAPGSMRAVDPGEVIGRRRPQPLPARPSWVNRRLSATGHGAPDRQKLRAARAAEAVAEDKLRREIERLPWDEKRTLADVAKSDPRVGRAIDQALARARIGNTQYADDRTADVELHLDLDVLWQEIRDAQ